ncbi:PD-(D/E)XK nuclease family transposase, partial [uncultured Parvimonas sp.]|uniref:PD-(D/E)XK nuclease family transposase n=1 Tax=uncultured Parvimonas sp. TaxID=747372 RepID=UPI00325F9875
LMAKKVFSNPEITAQFISDILDLPVHHVKILDGTQIHNHQFEDIKTYVTSIDVLAELNDGTQVIIEIQVAYQFDFIKRLWLYQCNQVTKNADEHKKEGVETHRLAEEMLPVYSIAIMQKRYFKDDKMVHVYCFKEKNTNEELKVYFKGFAEEQDLAIKTFLELEKYNEDKIEEYKKERWIEFFGNQPYTQTPEKILKQADRIVSRIDWTKEEREMYDERTRYIQAYLGHLASVEKEKKDARMEGLAEGKAHGIEHGKKMMIISLIKDGILSKEEGAKRLSISVIELDEYMSAEE